MTDDLEFRFHLIDYYPWLNAVVYFTTMAYYGVSPGKALIVTVVVLLATIFHYGRRMLIKGGMAMVFLGLAIWANIVPEPSTWGLMARSALTELEMLPRPHFSSIEK
jgi:hypothetical protein